ncbi:MAG: hypothetical protein ACKVP0_17790 [Pirellulaceae bacterium]
MSVVVSEERNRRRAAALGSFSAVNPRPDAPEVIERLDVGLSLLRNQLYTRLQSDVQRNFGTDSMLMPLSQALTEHKAKGEIDAFVVGEVLDELTHSRALSQPMQNRHWLQELRFAGRQDRAALETRADAYLRLNDHDRQMEFSDMLEELLREARLAPMILYQLFPLAVRAMAALAFGDHLRGGEIRNRQASLLPSITYCRNCHGRLMDIDESCRECGNPVWTIRWMSQPD